MTPKAVPSLWFGLSGQIGINHSDSILLVTLIVCSGPSSASIANHPRQIACGAARAASGERELH